MTHLEFLQLFAKQPMYFKNDFEGAVVRTETNGNKFVKFKGKEEF